MVALLWGYRSDPKSPARGVCPAWGWLGSVSAGALEGLTVTTVPSDVVVPMLLSEEVVPMLPPQRQVEQLFVSPRSVLLLSNASPTEMKDVWCPLRKYVILKERSTELVPCPIKNELQLSERFPSLEWCGRVAKAEHIVCTG